MLHLLTSRDKGLDGTIMLNFAAFIYALLSVFVLTSIQRNRREQRPDAPMLALVGWGLMSASFTLALLLTGVAAWTLLQS